MRYPEVMAAAAPYPSATRRGLILHDTLSFLVLLAITVALFGVTLFLFRSFEGHRGDLAVRWSARGKLALEQNRPEEAVGALRTALNYAPDDRTNQLLLAQALARAGHRDEATNYFLSLWTATPGDGFINLQLARLARQQGDNAAAEDDYRASIYGSWEGDAVPRRRAGRLELAGFLIGLHKNAEARNELFTVAGNGGADAALDEQVGTMLAQAGYLPDALTFYQKSAAAAPHQRRPLELAGRAAYELGEYGTAERLLNRAAEMKPSPGENSAAFDALAADAHRMQQLTLTRDQPAGERANHLLLASQIARTRLKTCTTQTGLTPVSQAEIATLTAAWSTATRGTATRGKGARLALLDNAAAQDTWRQLIDQTEQVTARDCGQPSGDDALLLRLANAAAGKEAKQNGK